MSDTPRTAAARLDEHDPSMAIASECAKMERELANALSRVKRLDEAGEGLRFRLGLWYARDSRPIIKEDQQAIDDWNQAKEAKP